MAKRQEIPTATYAGKARLVLSDLRLAMRLFDEALIRNNKQEIRIQWITCLTLARAVGHVLKNKDVLRSEWLRNAIEKNFNKIKEDEFHNLIYWEFINKERNLLLKEYGSALSLDNPEYKGGEHSEVRHLLIGDRSYSPTEALKAAACWWQHHISEVESNALAERFKTKTQSRTP
ncbi:hypothetical protein JYU29_13755 [Tianweitania sp. BSSL-BM11]|uniref:HEPN domain-containing protein n=1 Tax=Tianweitania aestuarii TaxID=2814886 RepID=A0ABS5RXG2_9HYPH|nr:hypothetical protein [Tianweitania aestuarii]MBS9721750.1 hypothetical protein [Tianweitania aestuarii]